MKGHNPHPAGVPTLCLGMVGFSPDQRAAMAALVTRRRPGQPAWRVGRFWEADAWWVNGSHIVVLPDGNLRVLPGRPQEHSLTLRLDEVHRPVAFSTPLASTEVEVVCTFDPASESDIGRVLGRFDHWLQPVLFKAELGALILERGAALRGNIYHVHHRERLLAVLDFRHGKAAVLPSAVPADLQDAEWERRPPSAHDLPQSFQACTPAQLVWTYACHTSLDLLPPRYRTETIYYRHEPRVPMAWLGDSTLRVLSALFTEPGNFRALALRTGIDDTTLARDLACLYYAGAVTTTAFKAAGSIEMRPHELPPPEPADEHDSRLGRSTLPPLDGERTAPAMLVPHLRRSSLST